MEVIYPKKIDDSATIAELQKIVTQLATVNNTLDYIENHTATLLGEFTWNGYTTNIYMLSGGVPSSVDISQYIESVCGVPVTGSAFETLDQATGLKTIVLYPLDYLEQIIASGKIITIGADKFVPLTLCEITVNNNELGDQLTGDLVGNDQTTVEPLDIDMPFLYNFYAVTDARNISGSDLWRLPTRDEGDALRTYLGNSSEKLKSLEGLYWNNQNYLGDGTYNFNAIGTGYRDRFGAFSGILLSTGYWSSTAQDVDRAYRILMMGDSNYGLAVSGGYFKKSGITVRLVREAPGVPNGMFEYYIGNDGKEYQAVCINQMYWMCEGLKETKFRNGDLITNVQDAGAWAALATEGFSLYDNTDYQYVANGGIAVVEDTVAAFAEVDSVNGINNFTKSALIEKPKLASLLMRKIN